ncbi:MAG: type IX secretion system sortase PorU [Bacteroidales bacterium]|nr:type IX secretion system sortase PorU [Bacteroidales bacterium]
MFRHILLILLGCIGWLTANAFSPDVYATSSRLSSGRWVKVSVAETGMYLITDTQLRNWGFSTPENVRIYGYGGARIPDELTLDNYTDDLPIVQAVRTSRGLIFYGVGPESWAKSTNGAYVSNPNTYSSYGYYFLSDTAEEWPEIPTQGTGSLASIGDPATSYQQYVQYEYDRTSPGEAGHLLVGESFTAQTSRTFKLSVPGANTTSAAVMDVGIVSNSSSSATVTFTVNGEQLTTNGTDRISATASSRYNHGTYTVCTHSFDYTGDNLSITISIPTASSMTDCWLDYIAVTSTKDLTLPSGGYLWFNLSSPMASLSGASSETVVWDVTNPMAITQLNTNLAGSAAVWTNDYHTDRTYAAWNPTATLSSPTYVGTVNNQNVHATECVDMVIFALPDFLTQAQRLATLHASTSRPLSVAVLNVDEVYNEFASGAADVSALRRCLKMLYDRGGATDSVSQIKYALLMGRATYDNRHLTSQFDATTSCGTIPYWIGGERRNQLSDNSAFGTDDFIAMLEDGSGSNLGLDDLCVAVGRMPVQTIDEAKSGIEKLAQYMQQNKKGTWRNHFLFLADDGDSGIHLTETEKEIANLLATDQAQCLVSKVYVDAYQKVAGACEGGRTDMYRMLDEGVVWWNYSGHANNHSWTSEKMLTYNDINNMYLNKVPVLLAATCDFLRWDSNTISGGEILHQERYGGTIATISATRPVYISENGLFTRAVGRAILSRDSEGMLPRLGDIYRNAKNNILTEKDEHKSNTNRLRYVLMGDPALELAMPSNIVTLDSIGDQAVDIEDQVTLMALQRTTLKGSVHSPLGGVLEDFNGTIEVSLYDAEKSSTTLGATEGNVQITFEQHGDILFSGVGKVESGRFSLDISMPSEIADNFREATLNMMAYDSDSGVEAVGVNRDFYVYGLDEEAPVDSIAPLIESFVMNHSSFKSGDKVNTSPMAIAEISDDVGINLSTAGIGHQMTLVLDDTKTYTDVSLYYTPASDGSASGTINYPFEDLTTGGHTLRLRVRDTSGNSASQDIYFTVVENLSPTIFEVYTDANPAITEANFYISHDRPDSNLTVTVSVYNLLGRPIWSGTVSGPSDMFNSAPVTWDLCDSSGRRVPRGIYLYRASITEDGTTYETASRRIAVAAP